MKNETLDLPNPNPSARIEPRQQRLQAGAMKAPVKVFL